MKKNLNKIVKLIFLMAMLFFITAGTLFIFSSCKSDYQIAVKQGELSAQETENNDSTAGDTEASENENSAPEGTGEETAADETDKNTGDTETGSIPETTGEQEQQTIVVVASLGGYSPKVTYAKAGQPTVLIMQSQDAYGCERAFLIPQLEIAEILPENGNTAFDLGVQEEGTGIVGVCSMGMYYFEIFFN